MGCLQHGQQHTHGASGQRRYSSLEAVHVGSRCLPTCCTWTPTALRRRRATSPSAGCQTSARTPCPGCQARCPHPGLARLCATRSRAHSTQRRYACLQSLPIQAPRGGSSGPHQLEAPACPQQPWPATGSVGRHPAALQPRRCPAAQHAAPRRHQHTARRGDHQGGEDGGQPAQGR